MPGPDIRTCVLATDLGAFGLVWSDLGLRRLLLPEADPAVLARKLALAAPGAPSDSIDGDLSEMLRAYAAGETVDFGGVELDLSGIDDFRLRTYAVSRTIGYGRTMTYGALAEAAGHAGEARETGRAMGANPVPVVIPCHRVIAAGGKVGGFSAPGGAATKARMLAMEGAWLTAAPGQAAFRF